MTESIQVTVRVVPSPNPAITVGLVNDRTVRKALQAAGAVADGFQIRVDGADATLDTVLHDGASILILKNVKGAADYTDDIDGDGEAEGFDDGAGDEDFIEVRIGKLPGLIKDITLNGDRSVAAAIAEAGLGDIAGFDIHVEGRVVDMNYQLTTGQSVHLLRKTKGA